MGKIERLNAVLSTYGKGLARVHHTTILVNTGFHLGACCNAVGACLGKCIEHTYSS